MTPTASVAPLQGVRRSAPAPVLGAASIALGHAVNDSYAYILPPLLPVLLTQAGITLSMGAALVAVNMLASSILQPIFGHWADQSGGGRWMAWTGLYHTQSFSCKRFTASCGRPEVQMAG